MIIAWRRAREIHGGARRVRRGATRQAAQAMRRSGNDANRRRFAQKRSRSSNVCSSNGDIRTIRTKRVQERRRRQSQQHRPQDQQPSREPYVMTNWLRNGWPTLAIMLGASVWGMIWYPLRMLNALGVNGTAASALT